MHAPVVGQAQTALSNPDIRKEADRRTGHLEYDVSKTIVDGSNPMKLVTPQPFLSGEYLESLYYHVLLM